MHCYVAAFNRDCAGNAAYQNHIHHIAIIQDAGKAGGIRTCINIINLPLIMRLLPAFTGVEVKVTDEP